MECELKGRERRGRGWKEAETRGGWETGATQDGGSYGERTDGGRKREEGGKV